MARGRKPTPTKLLELRGSWKAKTRPDEPQLPALTPTCPAWVQAEAQTIWELLLEVLTPTGMLTRVDHLALGRYCVYMAEWIAATAVIRQEGPTVDTVVKGRPVSALRPEVKLSLLLADRLLHLEQQFGLTPMARASIGIALAKGRTQEPPLDLKDPKRFLQLG